MMANNRHRAYVTVDDIIKDVMIEGIPRQNCSLDGDTVIIEMMAVKKWPEYPQPVIQANKSKGISNETPVESRIVDQQEIDSPAQELHDVEREFFLAADEECKQDAEPVDESDDNDSDFEDVDS